MITRTDLNERITEWGIREDVVEKDYAIGWALWAIGADPILSALWAFKDGTCLKKCFLETYRFSEDLDFTVLPGGPGEPGQVIPLLKAVLERVYEESGIDFQTREPVMRTRPDRRSAEGRIYYRGPRNAPGVASIRIDLTIAEQVVRPTVLRPIAHEYPDPLPSPAEVRCYSFEEIDDSWSPPSTVSVWGQRAPVEEMRFAAANHLRVELGYRGSNHLVEPYSLRKTRSGQLTLYAVESETDEVHSYPLDQIQTIRVSAAAFTPRFAVDVSGTGLRLGQVSSGD